MSSALRLSIIMVLLLATAALGLVAYNATRPIPAAQVAQNTPAPVTSAYLVAAHPLPAGTLRERSFDEIWNHAPLLQAIRGKTVADLRAGAGGAGSFRCSALALIEDGDYLGRFRRGEAMARVHAEARKEDA